MKQMIEAGMNIARLNFSHGDFAAHKAVIENLRAASASLGSRITIMADLSGPKMRVGKIDPEPIELRPGDPFTLTTDEVVGDKTRVSVSFESLPQAVKKGDTLFLNDGYIQVEVTGVHGRDVLCTVQVGGELRSRKGLILPGIDLGISAFTKRDHECLRFALENGVDAVSQSFVEGPADINAVRKAAEDLGYHPFIIAKVERSKALDNIDAILDASDGIMVARGDLGVEVPIEEIPVLQKRLIRLANKRAKPVITATQMLESMADNRRPTRAEVTDVANAIIDGTDCVMLSAESAVGKYPVDAVAMLAKIAASVEAHRPPIAVKELYKGIDLTGKMQPEHLIAIGVEACLEYESPTAVFVPTHTGARARSIARFRFPVWTAALCSRDSTCQHLQFSSGVYPMHIPEQPKNWNDFLKRWLSEHGIVEKIAILTEGPSTEHPERNNRMEIIDLRPRSKRGS